MKNMKLYSIYTDELEELKDIFLESVKDDWEIHIEYLGKTGDGNGNFSTNGWYKILRKKIAFILAMIHENWGDIIIWSDIDIQFFSRCNKLIEIAMSDKDIVFQAEWWPKKEVNTGFCAIRCNAQTFALYKLALESEIEKLKQGDQSAINHILKENKIDIKWDILPKQFWATSHFMFDSQPPSLDIVLHHANCTEPIVIDGTEIGSVALKLEHMKRIKDFLNSQNLNRG